MMVGIKLYKLTSFLLIMLLSPIKVIGQLGSFSVPEKLNQTNIVSENDALEIWEYWTYDD